MTNHEYKRLIEHSNVLDHITLDTTFKELILHKQDLIATEIKRILTRNQIEKPVLHAKPYDTSTNYYVVDLRPDQIEEIVDMFGDLEVKNVSEHGETTAKASFYGSMLDRWNNVI